MKGLAIWFSERLYTVSKTYVGWHGAGNEFSALKPAQRRHGTRWNSHYVLHSDDSDASSKGERAAAACRCAAKWKWSAVTRLDAFLAFRKCRGYSGCVFWPANVGTAQQNAFWRERLRRVPFCRCCAGLMEHGCRSSADRLQNSHGVDANTVNNVLNILKITLIRINPFAGERRLRSTTENSRTRFTKKNYNEVSFFLDWRESHQTSFCCKLHHRKKFYNVRSFGYIWQFSIWHAYPCI